MSATDRCCCLVDMPIGTYILRHRTVRQVVGLCYGRRDDFRVPQRREINHVGNGAQIALVGCRPAYRSAAAHFQFAVVEVVPADTYADKQFILRFVQYRHVRAPYMVSLAFQVLAQVYFDGARVSDSVFIKIDVRHADFAFRVLVFVIGRYAGVRILGIDKRDPYTDTFSSFGPTWRSTQTNGCVQLGSIFYVLTFARHLIPVKGTAFGTGILDIV